MTDTIIKIQPSDLISDSMLKINHNFEIISNRDDVTESKLNQWVENIENQLADIRNDNGIISDTLLNNVQKLENKINNITNLDGITKEVQNIINNATTDVENLINDKAGEAISSRLGDYVKTSTLNKTLGEYVSSTAFDTYRSDSSKSSAQSSRIVANSKFLKLDNDGVECLVRISGEITEFKSVEDYFKSLSASEKAAILGDKTFSSDDKALEDPDVITKLIEVCERTFKTVISEMSVISQTVGPDNVENTIIATVRDGETGKDITASIFTKANKDGGSVIALNADNINIDGKHALTVKSGGNIGVQSGGNINIENGGNFKIKTGGNISVQNGGNFTINSGGKFQITSTNFNINSDGTVNVTGAIKATSLEIKGSDNNMIDISDETKLSNFVKTHQDTVSGGSSYDDKWLKDALNGGTTIDGGLVLSNAILTKDSNDNITAGMIGSNSTENDIRFFAGTSSTDLSDLKSASFRVYEDGTVYMSKSIIEDGGYIESSIYDMEYTGSVKMTGGKLEYNISGNDYGGKAVIGSSELYRSLISLYPEGELPGLYISGGYGAEINNSSFGFSNGSHLILWSDTYIEAKDNAVYKGFKTPIERIDRDGKYMLSKYYDHTVVVTTSGLQLETPDFPSKGTEFDIYVLDCDVSLYFYDNKSALELVNGVMTEYGGNTTINLNRKTYYHIIFDGECWLINH